MANNPIELMIQLAINSAQSKENLNSALAEMKKHYDKNPILLNIDFNKSEALGKIDAFISELNKKSINLDVKVDERNSGLSQIQKQAQDAQKEFTKLQNIMGKSSGGDSRSFDLDLDKVIIQLDNMSRKGIVAKEQINRFKDSIEALRGTNDRLKLKETSVDIMAVSASAGHSDKVLQRLSNSLVDIGRAQQELSGIKDKFNIDPSVNTEYSRISSTIQHLTNDLFKLQTVAQTGGADQIKLAGQIREVENRLREARAEMTNFYQSTKADTNFSKLTQEAHRLYEELSMIGRVSPNVLSAYEQELKDIANSTANTTLKTTQMEQAMARLKNESKNVQMNVSFYKQMTQAELQLDKLGAKLTRIGIIHKSTVDKMEFRTLTSQLEQLNSELRNTTNLGGLDQVRERYARLAGQVDILGARASTAARSSQDLGYAFQQALSKFPVWMMTATLFYAPIRGIQDLTEKVIELDSAMVNLRRVDFSPVQW